MKLIAKTSVKTVITILRMAVGWHFLYEGLIKIFSEKWSAESYLGNTFGFLSGFYHWLAASPLRLEAVDFLNMGGLVLIGLALFLGLWTRWASICGAFLLLLYYFAYPPFGISLLGGDGNAYIINPLFIETAVLVFFFFSRENGYGMDRFIQRWKKSAKKTEINSASPEETAASAEGTTAAVEGTTSTSAEAAASGVNSRREALKDLAALPVLGLFGWGAYRNHKLYGIDTLSGATIQINQAALKELKGEIPKGKLGKHELSRLVAGGNLIGGWAHARDLIYASSLFKAYNTEKKIFETLMLCEQAGINSINIGYITMQTMAKYKKITGGKIKVIVQVSIQEKNDDMFEDVKKAIDSGMDIIQMHGGQCDSFVRAGKTDPVGRMMDVIRSEGYVAGLGAHSIDTFRICEENGIIPDYYMATMHHDNYWSAHPRENRFPFETVSPGSNDHNMFHDNLFCPFPDETVAFVNRAKIPVMGYKVLAAGAIQPKDGFNWAFENGADFICVGMFDFQVVNDANICFETLQNLKNRKREWYA